MITEKELNSYRLTSMEEPTDEMLAQIMHEAADIYNKENEEANINITKLINKATEEAVVKYDKQYGKQLA